VGLHPDLGALKNLGQRVGRSTIARMLKAQGIPPVGTPDILACLLTGALGGDPRRGFLHDGSVYVAGIGRLRLSSESCYEYDRLESTGDARARPLQADT
jgi:hypothetical protein